jgi:hypothetical protein
VAARESAKVGVVVLSQYTAPAYALALLEEGSAGRAYLLKEHVAGVSDCREPFGSSPKGAR